MKIMEKKVMENFQYVFKLIAKRIALFVISKLQTENKIKAKSGLFT